MRSTRAGALAWAVQPVYVGVEVAVAALLAGTPGRDLAADTISTLGATGSPGHLVVDAAFVVFGLARAAGALLVRRLLPPGPVAAVAVGLWVVSGLAGAAVGFAPLDVDRGLHLLVATPVFLTQPAALLLTGLARRDRVAVVAGAVSVLAAVLFALGPLPGLDGAFERLALWPGYLGLGVLGFRLARAGSAG